MPNSKYNFGRDIDDDDYEKAMRQIDAMQPVTFGSDINVLIITDRLHGCAKGLLEYLQHSTDITADYADSLAAATQIIGQKPLDLLIIVGYLTDIAFYKAKEAFEKSNVYSSCIMYARLDPPIYDVCREYGIANKYDRRKPIDGFISFMRQCCRERASQKSAISAPEEKEREKKRAQRDNIIAISVVVIIVMVIAAILIYRL
jgi:hypothetical protein